MSFKLLFAAKACHDLFNDKGIDAEGIRINEGLCRREILIEKML